MRVEHGNSAEYRPSSLKVSGGVVGRRVVKDFKNILTNLPFINKIHI
jgi:hypothetical protein